jgi:hypothetical protein
MLPDPSGAGAGTVVVVAGGGGGELVVCGGAVAGGVVCVVALVCFGAGAGAEAAAGAVAGAGVVIVAGAGVLGEELAFRCVLAACALACDGRAPWRRGCVTGCDAAAVVVAGGAADWYSPTSLQ